MMKKLAYTAQMNFDVPSSDKEVAEKAAAHAFFLAEGQPFIDGNKRTAALALTVFLDLNDHELYEATDTELADILIDLGSGTIEQGEFFGWVCNHTKPKPQGGC